MKTNADLQNNVQQAVKWEPLLRAAEIGVDSWYQKSEACRIAWKAPGVWSVDKVNKNDLKI